MRIGDRDRRDALAEVDADVPEMGRVVVLKERHHVPAELLLGRDHAVVVVGGAGGRQDVVVGRTLGAPEQCLFGPARVGARQHRGGCHGFPKEKAPGEGLGAVGGAGPRIRALKSPAAQ
jgi:hypothetical protein